MLWPHNYVDNFECKYQCNYVLQGYSSPEKTVIISYGHDIERLFSTIQRVKGDFKASKITTVFEQKIAKMTIFDLTEDNNCTLTFSQYNNSSLTYIVYILYHELKDLFVAPDIRPYKCKITVNDELIDEERQISSEEDLEACFSTIPKNTQEKRVAKIFAEFHYNLMTLEVIYNDSNKIKLEFVDCNESSYNDLSYRICDYIEHAFDPPPWPSPPPLPRPLVENTTAQEEKREPKKKTRVCVLV